ncbi:hypothetical protein QBC41DRAFT_232494 [Cercophora samala]|uniref:Uncharacterized protein n=1 Tax=Cercophora samala TaxID=330535 RepID=A0AA40D7A8_9PEZI|nr:hypothetical protein QBC41DRAFT_232494 [Cercophora samala]
MWVLASVFAAGAEVGELIGGEPFIPEDGFDDGTDGDDDDDDTTDDSDDECPDENPKCFETDCNGNYLGLCTTAPNINCPCDECPPVERFFCSEEECKGEGEDENFLGTCKAEGSHKGCSCSYPACPIVRIDLDNGKTEDRPDRLSCSDCGGSVGLGHPDAFHCKGIKSTKATKALSDVWAVNSTWDLDTSFHLAGYSCPLTSPGARKTYGGANDDYSTPESVKEAIDSFCAKYKGADAEYSWSDVFLVASPQDDYPEHRTPTWLTVRKWKDAPASHNCSATNAMANYTIDFNECTQALYVANFACSVDNSTLTHGGSQPGFCLAYEIVTSEHEDPRGCVVYSIVAYNRDYRMFAAASTGGFLEPWSGGDSSTWRDGTQVFKGSRTSKGNGTSVAEGKKQPHAKVRLFE